MAQIIGQRWEAHPFADVSGSVPQEGVGVRLPSQLAGFRHIPNREQFLGCC